MDLVVDGMRASPGSTLSAPVGSGSAWGVVMTGVGGEGKARGMSPRDEIFGRSWRLALSTLALSTLALSTLALSGIVDDSGERNEKRGNATYRGVAHVTRECLGSLESAAQSEGRLTGILEGL